MNDKKRVYETIAPRSREDALKYIASDNETEQIYALWSIGLYDDDWQWVQNLCLSIIEDVSNYPEIKVVAIKCIGHIARIHQKLDLERVIETLQPLNAHAMYKGAIDDTLGDIAIFIKT